VPEVLIVDDDPDIRGMLAFTFGDDGFRVREAKDGSEALEALEAGVPDCMILDLMMPTVDGFAVLHEMRERSLAPDMPVLVLTAKVDERSFTRAWELGADEYLTKPVAPDALTAKLRALLEAKAGHPTEAVSQP
jgi:DNA-binding response OmpR family regulator